MSNVTVQSRVNPELKEQAEEVFSDMGMSIADAIRIFLQQAVNIRALPFRPTAKQPNAETLQAMNDALNGRVNRHETVDEIFQELDNH